ncbi:rhomboid family intramembrane serine protease [Agriterribacter sp.]|uniref:rhomboid family intramembrane serine protease n=1 Tax=Agriterribacter sp. TaxID=2821509 RepID=UPI002BFCDD05|nr:rhomboid family intramembrane serine protease [Agriterribacter sp.]HTN06425.1 rhomboid family intramembrane serine protease [Agriterribacter sp.]
MLLPVGDDNSDRTVTPYINYLLIAVNVLVFIFLQGAGNDPVFTYAYSTVPAEIITGKDFITASQIIIDQHTGQQFELPGLQPTPVPVYFTLLTAMFMHGGWAHLGGNMLYLWIFGDNIENRLGHGRYLLFYLICGILASLSHVFSTLMLSQSSLVPGLGASGAISGVLGGYLLLYPTRKVHVILLWYMVSVPALLALGLWITFQVISGLGILGGEESGGVAYAAHIGGFIAGFLLIKFFDPAKRVVAKEPFIRRVR